MPPRHLWSRGFWLGLWHHHLSILSYIQTATIRGRVLSWQEVSFKYGSTFGKWMGQFSFSHRHIPTQKVSSFPLWYWVLLKWLLGCQNPYHNPNRLKYNFLVLRKCIKCDYVIKGTSKWARKHCLGAAILGQVRGLVCDGSTDRIPGEPPIIAPPISCQIGLTRKSIRVKPSNSC